MIWAPLITSRAGIGEEWTPRGLRHSFVSIMSDSGVPLATIADLVGHTGSRVLQPRAPQGRAQGRHRRACAHPEAGRRGGAARPTARRLRRAHRRAHRTADRRAHRTADRRGRRHCRGGWAGAPPGAETQRAQQAAEEEATAERHLREVAQRQTADAERKRADAARQRARTPRRLAPTCSRPRPR
nr:tyrosine-type recombinase/integrase [Actinomadura luteofluorescens]